MSLDLTVDEVLTTTRAVRRRLDLERPVERAVVERCIEIALQAPNGGNAHHLRWVVVDDPAQRAAVAALYREGMQEHISRAAAPRTAQLDRTSPAIQRMIASTSHLREHIEEVPVLVVPAIDDRTENASVFEQANVWSSVLPAVWSFMLALRSRGLGSAWTTVHLYREAEMAELLGLHRDRYMQVGLFPVAYTIGTDFHPAAREAVTDVVEWNRSSLGAAAPLLAPQPVGGAASHGAST